MNNKIELDNTSRQSLLCIARSALEYAGEQGARLPLRPEWLAQPQLAQHAASFVTLKKNGELRGCIGGLQARQALVDDVIEHACAAAYRDTRFTPVEKNEISALHISISVLTPQEQIQFSGEQELLEKLQVGRDGLTIQYRHHRATFLPVVWKQLANKKLFLSQLKQKAGLADTFWSDKLEAFRYGAIEFGE